MTSFVDHGRCINDVATVALGTFVVLTAVAAAAALEAVVGEG